MVRKNPKMTQQNSATPTAGEVLPDGTILDLVRDGTEPARLNLLAWDGVNARVFPRIEHNGRVYMPIVLNPAVLRAVRLPTQSGPFGSTAALFTEIGRVFGRYCDLAEQYISLLVYFILGSWFADRLPACPRLSIVGPAATEASLLLRLLHCLCRRALLLGGVTPAGLCSLPMVLRPTLLIDQSKLSAATWELLRASDMHNLFVPRSGQLLDLYCAKATYTGSGPQDCAVVESSIQIALSPARRQLPVLDDAVQERLAAEFQPKLLMYYLTNQPAVRNCQFDAPGFTAATRNIACSLAACIVDDGELQSGIIPLLRDQDEQIKMQCATSLEAIVIEALLFFCHEEQQESVLVGEITTAANTILKGRRETLTLKPREIGRMLKSVGLFTRRLGSAGRGILLLDAVRRRIHQLAHNFQVRSMDDGVARCPHCTQTERIADAREPREQL